MPAPLTLDAPQLHTAIADIASAIKARHSSLANVCLIGIANGGLELNRRLARAISPKIPTGELDTSFYRDDIGRNPIPKESRPTIIPFDVTGKIVVLVDDVLHSGRTLNAALNELFDHGRPAAVELAILIDRGGRKLPFAADYVGITLDIENDQNVVVTLDADEPANDQATVAPAR
ncbi:MAG: bifunctional pyr operon transcriptional regulator/uracil phosphoribosyltransferase PyrR [Synoicihabitans sp.]